MKKVLFVAGVALLSLASCKKDYTCSCSSTVINFSYDDQVFNGTKEDAQNLCDAREITLTSTSGSTNIACELK